MKKLLAFSLLFALSAANAQAAAKAGSTPMSALTMPIPTPVTAIIPTRLSKINRFLRPVRRHQNSARIGGPKASISLVCP